MQENNALIGIFDETGKIIGQKTRGEVNKKSDILKNVIIMVINSKNQILITRPMNSVFDAPWGSAAAGLVRLHEEPKDTVLRTLQRELGLTCPVIHIHDEFYNFDGVKRFSSIFYCKTDIISPNQNDILETQWVETDFVENNLTQFIPTFLAAFKELKTQKL